MKVFIYYLAFLIVVFFVFPYVLVSCNHMYDNKSYKDSITLYDKNKDKITKLKLEEYMIGVLAAEMPASFSQEALKAQAVAGRTYAIRKINKNFKAHKGADVCSDFSHCQAYINEDEMRENWGEDFRDNYKKIKKAVANTKSEVLKYNDEFAITVFHSCSNGITEKASDVWGGDIAYLTNVKSEGDILKKDYITRLEYSADEFIDKLNKFLNKEIDIDSEPIADIKYTSGNNVDTICLYGEVLKGVDIRKIYSLKSSAFELKITDNKFVFEVMGSGHGVGMSQYGAEKMAREKKTYKEILAHYYPGTQLLKLNN